MTNYNERLNLDEVLERYRLFANMAYSEVEDGFHTADEFKDLALPKVLDEAKQAILDWHNKQTGEVLDRFEQDCKLNYATWGNSERMLQVSGILKRIEAERNKLKEIKHG